MNRGLSWNFKSSTIVGPILKMWTVHYWFLMTFWKKVYSYVSRSKLVPLTFILVQFVFLYIQNRFQNCMLFQICAKSYQVCFQMISHSGHQPLFLSCIPWTPRRLPSPQTPGLGVGGPFDPPPPSPPILCQYYSITDRQIWYVCVGLLIVYG